MQYVNFVIRIYLIFWPRYQLPIRGVISDARDLHPLDLCPDTALFDPRSFCTIRFRIGLFA